MISLTGLMLWHLFMRFVIRAAATCDALNAMSLTHVCPTFGHSAHAKRGCAGSFFYFVLYMLLTCLYFTFYGTMAVAITPNLMLGAVVSSFFYGIWCGTLLSRISWNRAA